MVQCVIVSVWLLWFRCAVVSVNSDLSCMFINKISTVKQKKKKKVVEYMGQGVCSDYGVFCVLLDSCGDLKPPSSW